MFCKYCGKQIDDDSSFCIHCGKNLTDSNQKQENKRPDLSRKEASEEKEDSSLWGCWLLFLPLFLTLLIVVIGVASSSNGIGLVARDLRSSDYTYTTDQDLTSYRITIVPNRKIDNCDIELTLYDSNGKKLFSDTIQKTDLKEGNSYTYTFDFGYINSLSGCKVKFNSTGRCK